MTETEDNIEITVFQLIYRLYFPFNARKHQFLSSDEYPLFKLVGRRTDISKPENVRFLYYGKPGQPVDLYEKKVCKFWFETKARSNNFIVWILYDD